MDSKSKRMIFYIPSPWDPVARPAASQIRPQKMLQAFKDEGFEVDLVFGSACERKVKIADIKEKIKQGVRYKFCYVESSTMPTLLTDPGHLPLHPFLDYGFWWKLKRSGIPVGIFYRDIYWKFPEYRENLGIFKSLVGKFFYHVDFLAFRFIAKCFFIPSKVMRDYLPGPLKLRSADLPPGCESSNFHAAPYIGGPLRLLYVGGLGVHYNLEESLKTCNELDFVELTLCVRRDEWEKSDLKNLVANFARIQIRHVQGDELRALYQSHHASLLTFVTSSYRKFAMPFKLFEAIGYQAPIITNLGTAAADFVREHQLGFVISDSGNGLRSKLLEIHHNPKLMSEVQSTLARNRNEFLWTRRVKSVEKSLS